MVLSMGINMSHDPSACIVDENNILVAISEERLNREKASYTFLSRYDGSRITKFYIPFRSITYCLNFLNKGIDEIDIIVLGATEPPVHEKNLDIFLKYLPVNNKRKVITLPHPSHHLSHAYSAFYCSGFPEANILVVDCYGSDTELGNEGESGFYFTEKGAKNIFKNCYSKQVKFSLGTLYRVISQIIGFYNVKNARDEAGKTMALASFGQDSFCFKENLIRDGFLLNFDNIKRILIQEKFIFIDMLSEFDEKLRVNIRQKEELITSVHKDLARGVQDVLEDTMVYLANQLYSHSKVDNLCVSGGVGLNSVVNRIMMEKTPYKNFFFEPASTDDGTALGCAFYGIQFLGNSIKHTRITNVFFGKTYTNDEIKKTLENNYIFVETLPTNELSKECAKLLAQGKIIGLFNGRSEFGPRALGHRSILADPRQDYMKDILNNNVKRRESFRPFAPSVLKEFVEDYFDMISDDSPFMIVIAPAKPDKLSKIPAVLHIDGTARIQTVDKNIDSFYYDIINNFYLLTGIPMVLNTSFNFDGEPIVESPDDAIKAFKYGRLDYLVIGNFLISKEIYLDEILNNKIPIVKTNIETNISHQKVKIINNFGAMFDDINQIITLSKKEADLLGMIDGKMRVSEIIEEYQSVHSEDFTSQEIEYFRNFFFSDIIGFIK